MTGYYQEGPERSKQVQHLFTKIAKRYDWINDLQSGGMHRRWKNDLVKSLRPNSHHRILDLACGSGDLAFRILRQEPTARVFGADLTFPMLKVAQSRTIHKKTRAQGWIHLDALALPFPEKTFDSAVIGYGLRNMARTTHALMEIFRVLKPGGKVAILDFGKPSNSFIRAIYYAALKTVQPIFGLLFFGDRQTYRYIYESLIHYPAQEGIAHLMKKVGFTDIICRDLAFGMMSLHFGTRMEG